jgi:hypothetical protein
MEAWPVDVKFEQVTEVFQGQVDPPALNQPDTRFREQDDFEALSPNTTT